MAWFNQGPRSVSTGFYRPKKGSTVLKKTNMQP